MKPVPPATTPEQKNNVNAYFRTYGKDLRLFGLKPPADQEQRDYLKAYSDLWHFPPPAYAESDAEAGVVNRYRQDFGFDPRNNGLRAPRTRKEEKYLWDYTRRWLQSPPAYAENDDDAKAIDKYIEREGIDPRILYRKARRSGRCGCTSPIRSAWPSSSRAACWSPSCARSAWAARHHR